MPTIELGLQSLDLSNKLFSPDLANLNYLAALCTYLAEFKNVYCTRYIPVVKLLRQHFTNKIVTCKTTKLTA
jgi:hypothetical protein